MALIEAHKQLTLAEVNKAQGYLDTADILGEIAQRNEFLDEVPWFPSTHGSHTEQYKSKSLGKGAFTAANSAVPIIASSGDIMKEPVRLYQADSVVDDVVLKSADDAHAARDAQDTMNLEGIFQDFNKALLYANPAIEPDVFKSFDQRRKQIDKYCIDGGGTGIGLTSAWLFEFGKRGVFMIYNRSGSPGLKNEDRGRQMIPIGSANHYWGWVRHYEIWGGIVVANERSLQRYANITADGSASDFNPDNIIKMKAQLPTISGSSAILFVNRTIFAQIETFAFNKVNASLTIAELMGFGPILRIASIPVRPWEAISDDETQVA
jgi:hypothetical protein